MLRRDRAQDLVSLQHGFEGLRRRDEGFHGPGGEPHLKTRLKQRAERLIEG
ncbi:hypothetical protein D3C78_1847080 [compost metagenome]